MQEKFMKEALKEAKKAYEKLEVPVGCVIVKDGKIIARGHNLKETKKDTTKHAEIIAIQKASKKLDSWRLLDCEMYVTLEPCSMCAGAIINSRIKKLYIGTQDPKTGAAGSVYNLFSDYTFNHNVEVEKDILKDECEEMLKKFFKELRNIKKQKIKNKTDMRTAIATKFVAWEVPSLENLQGSKVYGLRTKLNNGEKLSREEKDWLTRNVNSNTYFKSAVPLQGWMFDFSDILRTYIVKQYGHWAEYKATDKTALRSFLYGRIDSIVELNK